MTEKFLDRGFPGMCYDLGDKSRTLLKQNLSRYGERLQVLDALSDAPSNSFDYLFAFEVLEHIQDDLAALSDWTSHLVPGGTILLSVPAHARKFCKSDEIVGHVRRYERVEMQRLLISAGYEDIRLINYGYPLTEVTRAVSNMLIAGETEHLSLTPQERSTQSSYTRPLAVQRIIESLSEKVFSPFRVCQRAFYGLDWGDGLVAIARKRL